jgi:hypothetical protein
MGRTRLLIRVAAVAALAMSASVPAQAPDAWFDPNLSAAANAERAKSRGIDPGQATRELIQGGDTAVVAAPAVVRAYDRCDAVYAAVTAAVQAEPANAALIANAVASVPTCPCTGENLWVRTRFDQRIRVERRDRNYQIVPPCACVTAIGQAAAAAAPQQAAAILDAAVATPRREGAVVDSLGQIGATPGAADALSPLDERRCERDVDPADAFEVGRRWQSASAGTVLAAAAHDCPGDGEGPGSALRIAGYVAGGDDRALVLENPTDRPIDLADQQYQLEIYPPGAKEAGRRFILTGEVPAKGRFVLAGTGSSAQVRGAANAVTPLAQFGARDALVLRRGSEPPNCECASAASAGIVNGLSGTGTRIDAQGKVAEGATPSEPELVATTDRLGQIRPPEADDAWRSPLRAAPLTWARAQGQCEGARDAQAPFALEPVWQATSWSGAALDCSTRPTELLLVAYRAAPVEGSDRVARTVAISNRTGAAVDLEDAGYVLELYAGGGRDPVDVVPLRGEVAEAGHHLVASEQSADGRQIEAALGRADLDAVVLRRLKALSAPICPTEIYAALREVGSGIPVAAPPPPLADGEPRTDESAVDPNRGGDIASPN